MFLRSTQLVELMIIRHLQSFTECQLENAGLSLLLLKCIKHFGSTPK